MDVLRELLQHHLPEGAASGLFGSAVRSVGRVCHSCSASSRAARRLRVFLYSRARARAQEASCQLLAVELRVPYTFKELGQCARADNVASFEVLWAHAPDELRAQQPVPITLLITAAERKGFGDAALRRLAAGDDPVTAIDHAYRIELLFWVLSDVTGRRIP